MGREDVANTQALLFYQRRFDFVASVGCRVTMRDWEVGSKGGTDTLASLFYHMRRVFCRC